MEVKEQRGRASVKESMSEAQEKESNGK